MKKYLYRNKKGMELQRDHFSWLLILKGYQLTSVIDYEVTAAEKAAK